MRLAALAGVAMAIGLILVGVGSGFGLGHRAPDNTVAGSSSRSQLGRGLPSLGATAVVAGARASAPSARSAAAAASALPPGQTEVCGAGPMPINAAGFPELTPAWAQRAERAAVSFASSLQAAAEPRLRAAGLLLQQAHATQAANPAAAASDAEAEGSAAAHSAGAPSAAALATLAAGSSDPAVYAAALRACQPIDTSKQPRADACQLVSLAQWARIDAANAVPWLHVATEAAARRDGPGLDEAMHRVATATASRTYGDVLAGLAIENTSDAADFEQTQMARSGLGIAAAWPLPAYQTVLRYCDAAALRDNNRMQICDKVARGFLDHPSSVIEWRIGLRVGERLDWRAAELAVLRERSDAYGKAMQLAFADPSPYGCAASAKARAFWLETARRGELAAIESVMASASGPAARPAR